MTFLPSNNSRRILIPLLVFFACIATVLIGGPDLARRSKAANPAAGTYTWVGGTPALATDWQVATNWSPVRAIPDPGDVLVFSGGRPTGTNVPTETIAPLNLDSGALVTLNAATVPAGDKTLTISGTLNVPSGTTLTLSRSTGLTISLDTGAAG